MSNPAQAVNAFRRANYHAARAAAADRHGRVVEAWQQKSAAKFYRTVAVGFLADLDPDGYARMVVNRAKNVGVW